MNETSSLQDCEITADGKITVFHFVNQHGDPISLQFDMIEFVKMVHAMEGAITKAAELSNLGVKPFTSPSRVKVGLTDHGRAVLLTFQFPNSFELHYAFEPTSADLIAKQISDVARRGMKAKQPSPQ